MQRSLFAKKDYSNTKQKARQGATKEGRGAVERGFSGGQRDSAAADTIFGLFRWRCLSIFFPDFILFAHANMETRSTQPPHFGKAATPRT